MAWPKRTPMYRAGVLIHSAADALHEAECGRYLHVNGRPLHPAMVMNWTIPTLRAFVRRGVVHYAELNEACRRPAPPDPDDPEFKEVAP